MHSRSARGREQVDSLSASLVLAMLMMPILTKRGAARARSCSRCIGCRDRDSVEAVGGVRRDLGYRDCVPYAARALRQPGPGALDRAHRKLLSTAPLLGETLADFLAHPAKT